jgi:hypothetical protein
VYESGCDVIHLTLLATEILNPKVSYWTELKEKYMKENPDIVTLDNYKNDK